MALKDLLKSSGTYVKWDDRGMNNPITGSIVSIVDRQSRKYMSEELDTWDDGTPKMQWIITINTDERHEGQADDDGTRVVVVNQWSHQKKAMTNAIRDFADEPEAGDTFTATWISGVGKAGDPRMFAYAFKKAGAPASMKNINEPAPASSDNGSKADLAKTLLTSGMSAAEVAEETGLSLKVINALAAQV
jgi:hypothetical protein